MLGVVFSVTFGQSKIEFLAKSFEDINFLKSNVKKIISLAFFFKVLGI